MDLVLIRKLLIENFSKISVASCTTFVKKLMRHKSRIIFGTNVHLCYFNFLRKVKQYLRAAFLVCFRCCWASPAANRRLLSRLLVPWARRWDISSRLLLLVDAISYLCILGSSAMSWRNLSSSNLKLSVLTQLMSLRNLVKSVAQTRLLHFLEGLSWVSVSRVLNHTLYSMSWVVSGFKFARLCIFDIWHHMLRY